MASAAIEQRVQAVRQFNRFYTRQIGVLQEGLYHSPFSLTEVRVLYELAQRDHPTASDLCRELGLDAGYLSRILRQFEKKGLISRSRSAADGRQSFLSLTATGRKTFAPLDSGSNEETAKMLSGIAEDGQRRLLGAMRTIETVLESRNGTSAPFTLRQHRPGDMGWITYRHGILYWQEYGYDERFEAVVADIVAKFIQHYDPDRERCWVAEKDGEMVGSVFLVKKSRTVAKLRLLLVEPSARGLGLGKRLVEECVSFARNAGYKKITLWTQSELKAARHLYELAGFKLIAEKPHASWSRDDLVSEVWEVEL
jgi:DNA-binding MarR family transcriptional regulator/N-acetylglutamate synthase-like GNAT family acetyltransferase